MKSIISLSILAFFFLDDLEAFTGTVSRSKDNESRCLSFSSLKMVSEIHIPGYKESKLPFILTENDLINSGGNTLTKLEEVSYTPDDWESLIPYQSGHLVHKTITQIFTSFECQSIVQEAERVATDMGWTTNRHGNYPTTDIPIVEVSSYSSTT